MAELAELHLWVGSGEICLPLVHFTLALLTRRGELPVELAYGY